MNVELDDLLTQYAYPLLKAAGYRRRRREAIIDGPQGMVGTVAFYPNRDMLYSPGFTLQYGVTTPLLRAFTRDEGLREPSWLSPSDALWMVQAVSPDWSENNDSATAMPGRWALEGDGGSSRRLGDHLAVTLEYEVFPTVRAWFDPLALAAAIQENRRGHFSGLGPIPRSMAMALAECGPSDRLGLTLESLPPDDNVRVWIERKLGER